jgi:hypothetical protein
MIRKLITALPAIGIIAVLGAKDALPQAVQREPARYLMLVATKNLDPSHEDAFNHWYNDIDIPDVLNVPGYRRARRGERDIADPMHSQVSERQYLALYDIETSNIDATIIDMLLAAKRMDATGRSIAALNVTERVYFRELSETVPPPSAPTGRHTFWYLERVRCCRDDATANALNDWYEHTRVPDAHTEQDKGLVRLSRYQVHRVVMIEPLQVPRYLAIYEFSVDSASEVTDSIRRLEELERKEGRMSDLLKDSDAAIYSQLRDVVRP